ncbi:hypothetical protein LCGC14_1357480, partial [marine sediment metagenome]
DINLNLLGERGREEVMGLIKFLKEKLQEAKELEAQNERVA